MRSSTEYNKTFKIKTDFYDSLFREKLKKALKYRKITQQELANLCNKKSQNATNKWLTQNDKYKTTPSAPELLAIADLLSLDIYYFSDPLMSCEEADKTLSCEEKGTLLKNSEAFVKTSITEKVFTLLSKARQVPGVYGFITVHSNGVSTALRKYADQFDNALLFQRAHSVDDVIEQIKTDIFSPEEMQEQKGVTIIFDDTEWLRPEFIRELIYELYTRWGYSLIFTGKRLKTIFSRYELEELIHQFYYFGVLSFEDTLKFLQVFYPGKSTEELNQMAPVFVGGIHDLLKQVKGEV